MTGDCQRVGSVVWLLMGCMVAACDGTARVASDAGAMTGAACQRTTDCRGGDFCDRGTCARVATHDQFGHGYGAQCVGEEFYPSDPRLGRAVHCRYYECVDGHCSSCVSDAECEPNYLCVAAPVYPGYPDRAPDYAGRRCTHRLSLEHPFPPCGVPENPVPCGPTRPELPEPTLLPNAADDCQRIEDCRGDEFCDRGRCAPILVDAFGHGYGAAIIRREPPALGDSCQGYLAVGRSCSSCLGDSDCYPEAPYCIRYPYRPEARSCARHPEAEHYDADGNVSPHFSHVGPDDLSDDDWLARYREFLDYHALYREARAVAGLPVPPAPPPVADGVGAP